MLRSFLICMLAAISIAASQAQTEGSPTTPAFSAAGAESGGAADEAQPKPVKSFDVSLLDRGVDPCTDFYRFTCGGWMANNPIPPDQAVWGRFNELAENNLTIERRILEQASVESAKRDADTQKIGDYYASCMDETAIEKKGSSRCVRNWTASPDTKARRSCLPTWRMLHQFGSYAGFRVRRSAGHQGRLEDDRRT